MADELNTSDARRQPSAEDAAALARFEHRMTIPIVLAAVLPLASISLRRGDAIAIGVNVVAWLVFVVDFAVHYRKVPGHVSTRRGRVDIAIIVLTAPWFLLFGPGGPRFVVLVRLAWLARLLALGRGFRHLIERVGSVALIAASVVVLCAGIAFRAEHLTNPGFRTFGDALWWGVVTLTTVGYGDVTPETTAGRVAAVLIMLTGIGLLGMVAGSIANFFRVEPRDEADERESEADLAPVLRELRDEVARLSDEVRRLRADRNPSP